MYVYMYIICPAYKCRKGREENAAAFCMKKLSTVIRQPSMTSSYLAVKHLHFAELEVKPIGRPREDDG